MTRLRPFKSVEKKLARDGARLLVDRATSKRLGQIRQSGTKPEVMVRAIVSSLGYRYRLVNRDLPGTPDLANRRKRWAVFVHGCYWHRHPNCSKATTPKRNREFWLAKFERNRERDREAQRSLCEMGFRVVVVWECELRDPERLTQRLRDLES